MLIFRRILAVAPCLVVIVALVSPSTPMIARVAIATVGLVTLVNPVAGLLLLAVSGPLGSYLAELLGIGSFRLTEAMLLAEGLFGLRQLLESRLAPPVAWIVTGSLTLAIAAQFAISASKGPKEFGELTRPYRRFVSAVRRANPAPVEGDVVRVDPENAYGVPELYLDPAAEVATCGPDVHVIVR